MAEELDTGEEDSDEIEAEGNNEELVVNKLDTPQEPP